VGTAYWIRRFLVVLGGAFIVIVASHLVRARGMECALVHGALWALITATVFTGGRFVQARRGQHCAVCRDTPELREPPGPLA
jgi:hypothetical protein